MRTASAPFTAAIATSATGTARRALFSWPSYLSAALTRTNECPTPSATYGIGWWQADTLGSVITVAAPPAVLPSGRTTAFKLTWAAAGAGLGGGRIVSLPTVPGVVYTFGVQVWVVNSPAVKLQLIGSSGATVSSAVSTVTGAYQQLTIANYTAVDTTTTLVLTNNGAATAGHISWYGDILFERAAALGSFFDGDSASSDWDGPYLGGSPSVLQLNPYHDLTTAAKSYGGQAAFTTDMPDGTRNIAGYPARTGTLLLSGRLGAAVNETVNAAWLFDANSTTSPLYNRDWTGPDGVQVVFSQGLSLPGATSDELYEVITAHVDAVLVNRRTGEVTLSLIDSRFRLSGTPAIPSAFNVTPWAPTLSPNPIMAPGLTALWPLDYMLRDAGIYTSPPPRPACYGYVSLHGSLWPEVVGTMTDDNTQMYGTWPGVKTQQPVMPAWQPGANVGQVPVAGVSKFPLTQWLLQGIGARLSIEGWFKTVPATGTVGGGVTAEVGSFNDQLSSFMLLVGQTTTGQIQLSSVSTRNNAPSYAPGAGFITAGLAAGWHQITACYTFADYASTAVTYFVDNLPIGSEAATGIPDLATTPMTNFTVTVDDGGVGNAADTWQVFGDPVQLPTPRLRPGAKLDASLNNLTAVPAVPAKADSWATLQAICDAEGAVAGFDETDLFAFRNRANAYSSTSQTTVACLTRVKELQVQLAESTRARTVSANAFPLRVGTPAVVWSATQVYGVAARSSLTILATLPYPTVFIPASAVIIPAGGFTTFANNGWRASYAPDGSGARPAGVSMAVTQLSSTVARIVITNPTGSPIWMVSAHGDGAPVYDGQPALNICGTPIAPAPQIDTSGLGSSGALLVQSSWASGLPALNLSDSAWRQDVVSTQQFTDDTVADLYRPRPLISTFTIVGDSRLQLGDRVTLTDSGAYVGNGFGPTAPLADDVILTAINPSMDRAGGFTQTCIGRYAYRPGAWVLGVAGRSELGLTTTA